MEGLAERAARIISERQQRAASDEAGQCDREAAAVLDLFDTQPASTSLHVGVRALCDAACEKLVSMGFNVEHVADTKLYGTAYYIVSVPIASAAQ